MILSPFARFGQIGVDCADVVCLLQSQFRSHWRSQPVPAPSACHVDQQMAAFLNTNSYRDPALHTARTGQEKKTPAAV